MGTVSVVHQNHVEVKATDGKTSMFTMNEMSDDGHTMTGTYSGNMSGVMSSMQSCGGAMNNGRFTLTR